MQPKLSIVPLENIPLVQAGDNLSALILDALAGENILPADGDILVVAQKIISKSEGRTVRLDTITPSREATNLAVKTGKDPRLVELILSESTEVVRSAPGVIIVRHRLGIVSANAGIDQSNIDHFEGEWALLLPEDPDQSARELRKSLSTLTGKKLGIIVSDSMNRPWRLGTLGYAIGSAGITVLDDRRGETDIFGRELKVTVSNRADAIAAAATLVMGGNLGKNSGCTGKRFG
jgi:coenzyme F420-0:L-glutamate ligase/coenzyme F420-1:gamma-L-glutamate ligase